ncbi:MAG: DUF882 domain-containing protein [Deltaproteobacteria bacterium]|nr:DUF882 domain-containing protein [Deltaproteobacteria bacterium]
MRMWTSVAIQVVVPVFFLAPFLRAEEAKLTNRYFLSGDGTVSLTNPKTNRSVRVHYRTEEGTYPQEARQEIDRLFGVSANSGDHISLRLVSALDYVEDQFDLPIVLISGYRSEEYNSNLRAKGGGAAKASMHIEGMAADIKVRKNLGKKIWESVKAIGCCGIGFYGGDSVHIDTGPARYWTQATSKVRTNISENNKQVMVRTDQDIYRPGEKIEVKLARITAYPVSMMSGFTLVRDGQEPQDFSFDGKGTECHPVREAAERAVMWTVPENFSPAERLRFRLRFCDKQFPEMPDQIESNEIAVR